MNVHKKSKLYNKPIKLNIQETINNLDYSINGNIPIGVIIPIHSLMDMTKVINDEYWKLCDGTTGITVTYPDGTTYDDGINNFDLPDLTDDRFLMGVSAGVSSGGSNSLSDHKHSTYDTDLNAVSTTMSGAAIISSGGSSGTCAPTSTACSPALGSAGGHCHAGNSYTIGMTGNAGSLRCTPCLPHNYTYGGGAHRNDVCSHRHCVSSHSHTLASHTHTITNPTVACLSFTGTIGTDTATDISAGTMENRPKYFSVKYYMRIK